MSIFDDPMHPYTQALWRSIPIGRRCLEKLVPISGTLPSPYWSHPRLPVLFPLRAPDSGCLQCDACCRN
jgi:ABC-type dipeptide/oligopeptide/nickel transport system ATPase component